MKKNLSDFSKQFSSTLVLAPVQQLQVKGGDPDIIIDDVTAF